MKAEALDTTRMFFESCIPEHLRHQFLPVARRVAPEEWAEITGLRKVIDSDPVCTPSYSQACERFKYLSKKVIIRASFEIMKANKKTP